MSGPPHVHRLEDVSTQIGDGLDGGTGKMCSTCPLGYAAYCSPGSGVPPWAPETCEGGHEKDAVVTSDLRRQWPYLCCLVDHAQPVAQPLDGPTRGEDRTFERVGKPSAALCGADPQESQATVVKRPRRSEEASAPEVHQGTKLPVP